MDLKTALQTLDPENDEHWTQNGFPALAVVREATGNDSVSRKDIQDSYPNFSRDTLRSYLAGSSDSNDDQTGSDSAKGTADDSGSVVDENESAQSDEAQGATHGDQSQTQQQQSPDQQQSQQAQEQQREPQALSEQITLDPNALMMCGGVTTAMLFSDYREVAATQLLMEQIAEKDYDELSVWLEQIGEALTELSKIQSACRDCVDDLTVRLNQVSQIRGMKQPTETFHDHIKAYQRGQIEAAINRQKRREMISGLDLDAMEKLGHTGGNSALDASLGMRAKQTPNRFVPVGQRQQ